MPLNKKITYEEQLQTQEWKHRRAEIIERDFGMCQKCMSSKNLHVHHTRYIDGLMAWEYSDWYLITLCANCHSLEHGHSIGGQNDFYAQKWASIYSSLRSVIALSNKQDDNGK